MYNHLITDELLAAFLDGNASPEETRMILNAAISDPALAEVMDLAGWDETFAQEDMQGSEPVEEELLHTDTEENMDDHMEETANIGFAQADTHYGKPAHDISFDPDVFQYYDDTCAFQSQAIILREYGKNVTQEELVQIAREQGWYVDGYGTPLEKVGRLMEHFDVDINITEGNNIFNIAHELGLGHRIIVAVDSGELWNPGFSENMEDLLVGESADHALIVAGLDTSDPSDVKVILTDPGNGNTQYAYSEKQFMDAWKDSNCHMVSTTVSPDEYLTGITPEKPEFFADVEFSTIEALSDDCIDIHHDLYHAFYEDVMNGDTDIHQLEDIYGDSVMDEPEEIDDLDYE